MRHGFAAWIGAGLMLALGASFASAQQPPARIRGSIEKLDGNMLHIKSREVSRSTCDSPITSMSRRS